MSTDLTRTTVNLNTRAHAALAAIMQADGCTKTDSVNRALVAYSYLAERVRLGAELQLLHAGGRVEAVTFL